MNAHEGIKPYHCPSCEYACTQVGNMRSHMKRKHGIDNPTVRAVTPAEPNVVQAPAAAGAQKEAIEAAGVGREQEGQAQGGARRKTKKIKPKKLKSSSVNPLPLTGTSYGR